MKSMTKSLSRFDLPNFATLLAVALALLIILAGAQAQAHDVYYTDSDFAAWVINVPQNIVHEDQGDFKGSVNLNITNTGVDAWGDFHFAIYEVSGFGSVESIDWIVDAPYQPTSSQSDLTWAVDNVVVGATLDLYFYDDPVLPGETAWFKVYTDNTTDEVSFFGTSFYPTPVPLPGAALLLGSGLLWLVGWRRRSSN